MLEFPSWIDPVAISIGPLSVHWYGLMYLAGFYGGLWLGQYRARTRPELGWTEEMMSDFLFYAVVGIIAGGRIGSVFFYHFDLFLDNPIYLFKIWEGGMSFHGGFLGVCVATWLFARKHNRSVFEVGDFIAPLSAVGLGLGRIGNFINQELWGSETTVPWAMNFPAANDGLYRHPSQIYEFLLEGVVLFIVVWLYSRTTRPQKAVAGLFMMGYGCARIFVEFFRLPDVFIVDGQPQLGYLFADVLGEWFTRGMLLSLPMVIVGALFMMVAYKQKKYDVYKRDSKGNATLLPYGSQENLAKALGDK